jgi:hypothetical protein
MARMVAPSSRKSAKAISERRIFVALAADARLPATKLSGSEILGFAGDKMQCLTGQTQRVVALERA